MIQQLANNSCSGSLRDLMLSGSQEQKMDRPQKTTNSFNPCHQSCSNIQWLGDGSRQSGMVQKKVRCTTAPREIQNLGNPRQKYHNSQVQSRGSLDISAPMTGQLQPACWSHPSKIPNSSVSLSPYWYNPCNRKDEMPLLLCGFTPSQKWLQGQGMYLTCSPVSSMGLFLQP